MVDTEYELRCSGGRYRMLVLLHTVLGGGRMLFLIAVSCLPLVMAATWSYSMWADPSAFVCM